MENNLLVGFGRRNITPTESVPLAGYGNTSKRLSTCVLNDLFTTCIAFTDGEGETVLLFYNDLVNSSAEFFDPIRQAVSDTTGIPFHNIMVSATHTHSGPDLGNGKIPSIPPYHGFLKEQMVAAAVEALADRKEATIEMGSTIVEGMNFVRHYIKENGCFASPNHHPLADSPIVRHATKADPVLQVLRFQRQGGKPVVLINWQTHPHRAPAVDKFGIASDVVGAMRDALEEKAGCLFAYFTGGSGNINTVTKVPGADLIGDYVDYGNKLADHAMNALSNMQYVPGGKVACVHKVFQARVNHSEDHKLEDAKMIQKIWRETNDGNLCRRTGRPLGIYSPYHANAIVAKYDLPLLRDVNIYAFRVGGIGFVTAPYEMFDTNGQQIKWGSPFAMTFVLTCSNDGVGYIPSAYGYHHGCYEADCTRIAPGTGEELVTEYLQLLGNLFTQM